MLKPRKEPLLQLVRQRLAAGDHPPQARALPKRFFLHEHLQHGRYEVDRGDLVLPDRVGQIRRILMTARPGHHQACPGHQGPEELPYRYVEAVRRLLKHRVRRVQPVLRLHPHQPVDDPRVLDHHALGPSGRTGRVDHVRQVRRVVHPIQVGSVQRGNLVPLAVHGDHPARKRAEPLGQRPLHQHHVQPALFEDRFGACRRVLRVQRHVRPAGLQHRVQRHDHLERPLHAHAHRTVRTHAHAAQVTSQPVRASVQLRVRVLPILHHQGHRVRTLGHLPLEQRVQAHPVHPVVHRRRIQPLDHLPTLVRSQQRPAEYRSVRIAGHGLQRPLVVARQPLRTLRGQPRRIVVQTHAQLARSRLQVEVGHQRTVRVLDYLRIRNLHVGHAFQALVYVEVIEVERRLKQRLAAQLALQAAHRVTPVR